METVVLFMVILVMSALRAEESLKIVPGQCVQPLGMEEGKIPDDAITASSSYELKSVGPQNARIRQEKNGGAWCPKAQISSNIREYLEVDLTRDHLITWTETQGRFGNGQGQEYAEAFFLEYWRDDRWHQYRSLRGDRVLRGNSNTYLVERQKLELPFVASRVRFVPYSQHPRTVCMRVEIYGCVWDQRLASYTAPKGEAYGPNGCNAEDSSYDGVETNSLLTGGLGQLTDGIFADEAETTVSSNGSNWVGWCDRGILELIFEFRDAREFENCTVHLAHSPELGIEVFSALYVWFSPDGKQYHPTAEKLEVSEEIKSRTVSLSVALPARIGKFVKLEFHSKSKWLLISEVTFETVTEARNATTDQSSEQIPRGPRNESDPSVEPSERPTSGGANETIYEPNAKLTPDAFPVNNSQTYIGLASGALTVVALLLTCTIFLMKQRGRNKVALLQKHTALLCGSPAPGITINMKDIKLPTPIVVNGLSQSRLSVKSGKTLPNDDQSVGTASQHELSVGHDYERCSAYERTYKLFSDENLAYEPHSHKPEHFSSCKSDYSDLASERSFQDEKFAERIVPTPFPAKKINHSQPGKTNHKVYESYYAATDILTIKRREQTTSTSLFTPLHIRESMHLGSKVNSYNVQRISRHRLRILDKLGEGSFGLVHLCEAKGIQNPDLGTVRNRQVVIVRSLWRGVIDSLREDFAKDMYSLATIRDINIARIIALVEEEPFGAVFEYGELGDLPTFFENHEKSDNDLPISYGCLLNFITQIASGMKYLEGLNIPHCDLAARNCIVNQNLLIKVSDHAMYCSKYDHDYYVGGCYTKIPLRWMAWEAVLLGKQSCQSDVWSYAVTIWEILTNCKDPPHADLTSEQVLENLSRWYHGGNNGTEKNQPRILSQPACCSAELYRMMVKCWSKHAEDRPTFDEIYLYLKRLGFD